MPATVGSIDDPVVAPTRTCPSNGSTRINQSAQCLDGVPQSNTSASEELSAAATELLGQAKHLAEVMGFFQTDNSGQGTAAAAAAVSPTGGPRIPPYGGRNFPLPKL